MSRRSAGKGASLSVQRALEWTGVARQVMPTEIASCALCGAHLRFTTGEYGQTLEVCTSGTCPGRVPHSPRPSPPGHRRGWR